MTIRGSDVDYVRANIHCATSIGRARRKEVEAAQEAAAEKRKKKSDQMKPSEKYKTGSVPKVRNNQFSTNLLSYEFSGLGEARARDWSPKFETGLNMIICIVQKV